MHTKFFSYLLMSKPSVSQGKNFRDVTSDQFGFIECIQYRVFVIVLSSAPFKVCKMIVQFVTVDMVDFGQSIWVWYKRLCYQTVDFYCLAFRPSNESYSLVTIHKTSLPPDTIFTTTCPWVTPHTSVFSYGVLSFVASYIFHSVSLSDYSLTYKV